MMNNSAENYTTNNLDEQKRIAEAQLFFDALYGKVTGEFWGYLWTAAQDNHHKTFPFLVTDAEQRAQMAKRAIELSDAGNQVYFGVNLLSEKPSPYERGKNTTVTIQVAVICDIDIVGGTHKQGDGKIYAPDFDTAKSFLPFPPSIVTNSGYGLHAYLIFAEPLTITDENRQVANRRNVGFIKLIRNRAGDYGKTADGVGDLARVLRVPATFNYKLGIKDDAPLCRIVEVNDVRFTTAELDEQIAALTPKQPESPPLFQSDNQPRSFEHNDRDDLDKPTEQERAIAMLPFIKIANGDHDRWVHVGMILKSNGNDLSDWEQWSATQPNYTPDKCGYSCADKWATFPETCAMTIATLHDWAVEGGYSEKEFQRDWYAQHPEIRNHARRQNTTQNKISDCPVDLILPPDVLFDAQGITLVEKARGKEKELRYFKAAATPIVPTKIFRNEHSGFVQYELAILDSGGWRRHVVDGATITDSRACNVKLGNFGALIEHAPTLCKYLTRIIDTNKGNGRLKTWRVFAQPGWYNEKYQHFIYPSGGEDYIVARAGYNLATDYSECGDADEWRKIFAEAMENGGRVARLLAGVGIAAPLVRPLGINNLQAHIFGEPNAGKTVLTRLVAGIYGKSDKLVGTFETSPKRRQADAAANNDLCTFFDELETVRGQKAELSLTQSVYAFFNGKGNQNMNVDGSARDTFEFKGSRLTTGERQILKVADQFGAYKRLLPINYKDRLFDKQFAAKLYRFTAKNFGHFGRPWTTYIAEHLAEIQATYEAQETDILADDTHEETQLRTICAAGVAYQFFAQCIGLQDKFDSNTFLNDVVATINELPTVAEMSETSRAVKVLKDWVAANENGFYRETKIPNCNESEPKSFGVNYGKLYLNGEVAIYQSTLSKILIQAGFASPDMLIGMWFDEGKLIATHGRQTRRRIGVSRKLVILFNAGVLSEAREDYSRDDDADNPPPPN